MLVSWNWLSDYVSPDASISDVTDRLTMSGLNLEETQTVANVTCIDLEVTSNRADCLGHIGVAREIAALYGVGLCVPEPSISDRGTNIEEQTSVAIECEDLCEEYHARLIRGVKIGPSPDWLVERLKTIGVTSVNNVVDVTNYVMFECGQPLHAFDFNTLDDERIVVRRAIAKETIIAIDQKQYELPESACVIADGNRAVAVAGVMGGLDTEISERTTDVLIEAASFDPVSVRSTARTLKLHSPSSYRFERRVDRCQLDWASQRCCELIQQVAGGELQSGSIVAGHPSSLLTARTIRLRFAQVERLLGIPIDREECLAILRRLGIECVEAQPDAASFLSPSWRADLTRECDLIEEIARVHGYDKIPDDAALPVVATHRSVREHVMDTTRHVLTACGISEAMTLSFVSAELRQAIQPRGDIAPVSVDHSSRSHENQLRQSLIPSLLHSRRLNERHGNANVSLFEVAKVYLSADKRLSEAAAEPTVLGIITGGGFARLKGIVASLIQTLAPSATLETRRESGDFMAPGRGAGLFLDGERLGWIAEVSSDVLKKLELQDAAVAAELDLHLLENAYQPARTYQPLPRFPSVTRDLNFVIPESVSWQELRDAVESAAGKQLQQVEFAGQYRGNQIGTDLKSYVVTCRFSAEDRTLKADEVDSVIAGIVAACEQQLQATLRS